MINNISLIERIHMGDSDAKNRMIENNLGLVEKIAMRFKDRGYDREEIVQVGILGLIKAIDKFDTSYNTQFSTYAFPVIEGEIKRFIRDNGSVKVSRSLKDIALKGRRAEERLRIQTGRDPTISEISDACKIAADELIEAFCAVSPTRSIYESLHDNSGKEISLMDTLADENSEERLINHVLVNELLSSLNARERKIIMLRYFEMKTQSETAAEIGVSQVQVSRLEKKILMRLRNEHPL